LTGVRALAACWVMLHHLNAIVNSGVMRVDLGFAKLEVTPFFTIGWAGVDLFFVLSGFLLTTHLLESAQRKPWPQVVPEYLWARCRRVLPAYWAQIAILFLVAVASTRAIPGWSVYIPAHAVMVQNLTPASNSAINGVYWTLPIEFAFYLALPSLARILADAERQPGRRRWITLAFMLAAVIAATWAYRYIVFRLYQQDGVEMMVWAISQLPGTIDQFVMGVAVAATLRWWHPGWFLRRKALVSTMLVVAGLIGVVCMVYFLHYRANIFWAGHWTLFGWHTITAAFFAMLVFGIAVSSPIARFLFENRIALFLGTISYSIYLWHWPIALWMSQAVDASRLNVGTFALLVVPAVLAASAASYYLVERRFMSRRTVRTIEARDN
jgi:peptidoglycan/LPS O-acetylase OafA/YrhL